MTQYFPGPYEVEVFYTDASLTHKQRLNTVIAAEGEVGDPFSAFSVALRNGTNQQLDLALLAYLTPVRAAFASTVNFTIANLYKYLPNSYDKTFLATYDINLLGTGVGSTQLNHYTMLTFTTVLGNNMKLNFMEDNATDVNRIPIRDASAQHQAIANYVTGTTNWIIARDGSFPIGRLNRVCGQNEALFKQRNR